MARRGGRLTYRQIEELWIAAGGAPKAARIMAAIAMAESRGRNIKQQGQPYATTGWGLWQITPGGPELLNPMANARAAVEKYNARGFEPWTTYTSGAYKQFLQGGNAGGPQIVSPVGKNAQFARVDQGVDYSQNEPYVAIGSGTVYAIGHGFAGPAGQKGREFAVYIRLDHPITVNGRTYREVYYAETTPLVRVGQHVRAGQPVSAGGAAEIGFAHGAAPAAPLVGGLGAGTQSSVAGHDFLDVIQHDPHVQMSVGGIPVTASQHQANGLDKQPGEGPGFGQVPDIAPPGEFGPQDENTQEGATGMTNGPLTLQGIDPIQVTDIWQQLAQSPDASPETRLLADNGTRLTQNIPDILK